MKKIFTLAVLVMMISFAVSASPCRPFMIVNGINYYAPFPHVDDYVTVSINEGDTLICSVGASSPCSGCVLDSSTAYWIFRGITTHAVTITATDTGVYTLYAEGAGSTSCAPGYGTFYLTVNYTTTSAAELTSADGIQISPTLSTGIFKIKNDAQHPLNKITVSDDAGRIVYTSSADFSEINITRFSSGIYFYAVEDETMKVYRGKLVKID